VDRIGCIVRMCRYNNEDIQTNECPKIFLFGHNDSDASRDLGTNRQHFGGNQAPSELGFVEQMANGEALKKFHSYEVTLSSTNAENQAFQGFLEPKAAEENMKEVFKTAYGELASPKSSVTIKGTTNYKLRWRGKGGDVPPLP